MCRSAPTTRFSRMARPRPADLFLHAVQSHAVQRDGAARLRQAGNRLDVDRHGRTEQAVGWLKAEWEIDASAGATGMPTGEQRKNVAPTISVASPSTVALPGTLPLTARVTDDGFPPVSTRVGGTSENPPAFRFRKAEHTAPVNVPQLHRARPGFPGLSVSWRVWRGPGAVAFKPAAVAVKDGQASTTATFKVPENMSCGPSPPTPQPRRHST